mmetsp:Transcript_34957/g.65240  ORF Transcript_34957/g.65240 Transcript_34957/m.65240 type:complete len:525 (+) Transcript_34957:111-1685(+)
MTKKGSKKSAPVPSDPQPPPPISARSVVSTLALVALGASLCVSFFSSNSLSGARQRVVAAIPSFTPTVAFIEKSAVRVEGGDMPLLYLKAKHEPMILLNSKVSRQVPRWTARDVVGMMAADEMAGVYRNNDSAVFGTYYDTNRPMHLMPTVHKNVRYEDNVRLSRAALLAAFPPPSSTQRPAPPFHALATAPTSVHPSLESRLDLRELVSLNPARSSVNLWLSSPGSVTPCHYDGYYNLYLQLSGTKRFTLLPPDARSSLSMFPFLHPSYGQCKNSFVDTGRGAGLAAAVWDERVDVLLQPGELLFIPPFWLHETEALSSSVSINVWTDIPSSDILQQILGMDVPGLSSVQIDSSLPIPLTPEDMTLLPVDLSSLTGRYMLGYVIAVEVVEGCIGKAKTKTIVEDVMSRYRHLIDDGTLIDMPRIMRDPLSALLSQWKVPLIAKKKASKYDELIGDEALIKDVKAYIASMMELLKAADFAVQPVTMGLYLEFLSERVCSTHRASSFISLLHHAYAQHIAATRGQ